MNRRLVWLGVISVFLLRPGLVHADDIADRVQRLVAEHLQIDIGRVLPETRFREDLKADDLDMIEIVMAAELEFECEIPDADADNLVTVADLTKFVRAHAGQDKRR